jgi:hypothetical protein
MGFLADDEFGFSIVSDDDEFGNDAGPSGPVYNSDVLVRGSANSLPTVSDMPETSQASPFSGLTKLLGSIGTTARDLGTAVGTARRDIAGAGQQYRTAQANAYKGNSAGQWWQYSTTMDKVMVGLAVLVVVVVIAKH